MGNLFPFVFITILSPPLMGWIIFRLWHYLPLPLTGGPFDAPFPSLWPWFFSIFLPAMFPSFSILLYLLRFYVKEKNHPRICSTGLLNGIGFLMG